MKQKIRRGQWWRRKDDGAIVEIVNKSKRGWQTKPINTNPRKSHTISEWVLRYHWELIEKP